MIKKLDGLSNSSNDRVNWAVNFFNWLSDLINLPFDILNSCDDLVNWSNDLLNWSKDLLRVRLNYATIHNHPPLTTTIHHHPILAKTYPASPSNTSEHISTTIHHQQIYIQHHPPQAKISTKTAKIYPPPPITIQYISK